MFSDEFSVLAIPFADEYAKLFDMLLLFSLDFSPWLNTLVKIF